jgi:CubicO group peptidase (beta-lactamase class C family)
VLEQGLGMDVGAEMNRRLFSPNGMTRSSLIWRADFRPNLADGFGSDGRVEPHDERSKVRASGSLDTSIADMGRLAASYVRGDGLSAAARAALVQPHLPITTRSQFPSFQEPRSPSPFPPSAPAWGSSPSAARRVPASSRAAQRLHGQHLGLPGSRPALRGDPVQRCARRTGVPALVASILGDSGVPWAWEYGDMKFWAGAR